MMVIGARHRRLVVEGPADLVSHRRLSRAIGKGMMPVLIFTWRRSCWSLFQLILRYTIYGKRSYAIGSNEAAARMSGIKVARHKLLVYIDRRHARRGGGVVLSSRT